MQFHLNLVRFELASYMLQEKKILFGIFRTFFFYVNDLIIFQSIYLWAHCTRSACAKPLFSIHSEECLL